MANQVPKLDELGRLKYEADQEEMEMPLDARREDINDLRASLYQPPVTTMPINASSQRDVVDFSFGRKDQISTTSSELRDLSKDDRLVLETFRALTAGNIGNIGSTYWPTRTPSSIEPTLPPFSTSKTTLEYYNPPITHQQKELLTAQEPYIGSVSIASISEQFPRSTKADERLYAPPPQVQPMETYPGSLTSTHRSQDALGEVYRSVLSGYRLQTYPPSYETSQGLNMKSRSPSLDIPISKPEELERSALQAARDREQSNMDFESIHANAARLVYPSDTVVGEIHIDKNSRPLEMDLRPSDFSTDRLRELAETVVYSQTLATQPNYADSMQKYDTSPYDGTEQTASSETTCTCILELEQFTQQNKKKYSCGGCPSKFITICQLHEHLRLHGSGGSFHFDHVSNTAYPKLDSFCSYVQTEDIIDTPRADEAVAAASQDTSDLSFSDSDLVELNKTNTSDSYLNDSVVVKSEEAPKTDSVIPNTGATAEPLLRKSTRKKRKQDWPKPSKARKVETKKVKRVNTRAARAANAESVDSADDRDKTVSDSECVDDASEGENQKSPEVPKINSKVIMKPIKKRKALRRSNISNEDQVNDKDYTNVKTDEEDLETPLPKKRRVKPKKYLGEEESEKKAGGSFKECHICKLLVPKRSIRCHMLTHDAPYICEVCGKTFARPRFLKKHQVVHAEVKPWKCEMCGQQFCQKTEYKLHMNGHDDIRPFECSVCKMRFLSKTTMRTHMANIHMGITKFECEICNRRFFKKSSLTVHQATHYEATMQCSFCERKFRDKTGLKRHERIHTGLKRYQCHICEHAFIQSTPFWVHMEKRHGMDRATVKTKLKELHEANRRSGIRTEINVLPRSSGVMVGKQEESDDKKLMSQSYSNMFSDNEENQSQDIDTATTMKSNAGVKFPVLRSKLDPGGQDLCASASDNMTENSEEPSDATCVAETIKRLFDQQTTQAYTEPPPPGPLPSLPNYLQHLMTGINVPQNTHSAPLGIMGQNAPLGLIGQNNAQPITCTTVPTSGTYTNITSQTITSE